MDRQDHEARVANLAIAARAGDRDAADQLAELMRRAMRSLSHKVAQQSRGRIDFDEGMAIMGHALARAIANYREDRGARFTAFAITVMTNAATSAARDSNPGRTRLGNDRPVRHDGFDLDLLPSGMDVVGTVESVELGKKLRKAAMSLLEPKHKTVLAMKAAKRSRSEILRKLGVGATTAWRIEREARHRAMIGIFASGDPELVEASL